MADNAEQTRIRILDAAAASIVEGGFGSDRLVSDIARRSGLSRPTVYKYGGTIDEIRQAVLQRELAEFVTVVAPLVQQLEWTIGTVADFVVAVVGYARSHRLFESLRDQPEVVSRYFFTDARLPVGLAIELIRPVLEARIESGEFPHLALEPLCDYLARLAISLAFSRTQGGDPDDVSALRAYVESVFAVSAQLASR